MSLFLFNVEGVHIKYPREMGCALVNSQGGCVFSITATTESDIRYMNSSDASVCLMFPRIAYSLTIILNQCKLKVEDVGATDTCFRVIKGDISHYLRVDHKDILYEVASDYADKGRCCDISYSGSRLIAIRPTDINKCIMWL